LFMDSLIFCQRVPCLRKPAKMPSSDGRTAGGLRSCCTGVALNSQTRLLIRSERLHWVEEHYDLIKRLTFNSVLMQITAGSLLGGFGRRVRYWSERMLDDGLCHLAGAA
jgi:hypothetical protein